MCAQVAPMEDRVQHARQVVIDAVGAQLVAKECDYRSYLAADDPFIVGVGQRVEQAVAAYRQARAARERLAQTIAQARQAVIACERGITEVRRQVYLERHHAELLERLATLRQDDPTQSIDAMHPRYYALHAQWRAQVAELEGQIRGVLELVGI